MNLPWEDALTTKVTVDDSYPTLQIFKYGYKEKKFGLLKPNARPTATKRTDWSCACMSGRPYYRKQAKKEVPQHKAKPSDQTLLDVGTKLGAIENQSATYQRQIDEQGSQ